MVRALSEMMFVAIDPGASGGVAFLEGRKLEAHSLSVSLSQLWGLFDRAAELQRRDPTLVKGAIEKVHSMPGQGVKSMFSFGSSFGAQRMCLVAAGIPFVEVRPQEWMDYWNLRRVPHDKVRTRKNRNGKWVTEKWGGETDSQWKNRLKARAQSLFPRNHITLATADAALMVEYLRRRKEVLK